MKNKLLLGFAAALSCAALLFGETTQLRNTTTGYVIGGTTTQKFGFHGATPTVQRSGAAQTALTDSTGGTAATTLTSTVGVQTIALHITLAQITGSVDVVTNYSPGYAFKILSVSTANTKVVTTGSKAATLNLEIGTTNLTGGAIALTSANNATLGSLVAGTSITAANTGTAADTLSVEASGVTAFVEGEVDLLITIQNMDTVNAVSSVTRLLNELRAADVEKGLIKGSS